MISIDLNADLGEGMPFDSQLLKLVSSASIACGGHAGTPETMRATLRAARDAKVRVGAHPGFVDKENFGRLPLDLPAATIAAQVVDQVKKLSAIATELGHPLSYIKLHGALYNLAAKNPELAKVVFQHTSDALPDLAIMAMAGSAQLKAAKDLKLATISEAFVDRAYEKTGALRVRSKAGAVFADPQLAIAQALGIAQHATVQTPGGQISCNASSLCLHGDNHAALAIAQTVRSALEEKGLAIKA